MSEPYLPIPGPEPRTYWNPHPARCPECGVIVDPHPASRADGKWEGWCPRHGQVVPVYHYSSQDSEIGDDDE